MQIFYKADFYGKAFETWEFDEKKNSWSTPRGEFKILEKDSELIFINEKTKALFFISEKGKFLCKEVLQCSIYVPCEHIDSSSDTESFDSQDSEEEIKCSYESCGGFYLTQDKDLLTTHEEKISPVQTVPIQFYYDPKADILLEREFRKDGWYPVDVLPGCWIHPDENRELPPATRISNDQEGTKNRHNDKDLLLQKPIGDLFAYFEKNSVQVLAHAEEYERDQDQYDCSSKPSQPKEIKLEYFEQFFKDHKIDTSFLGKSVQITRSSLNLQFSVSSHYANIFCDKISFITKNLMQQIPKDILGDLGFSDTPELDFYTAIPLPQQVPRPFVSYPDLDISVNITVWKSPDFTLEKGGIQFVQLMKKSLQFKQIHLWNSHRHFHFLFNDPNSMSKKPLDLKRLPPHQNQSNDIQKWADIVYQQLRLKGFEKKVPVEEAKLNEIYFKKTANFSYFFLVTWNPAFSQLCEAEISSRIGKKIIFRKQIDIQTSPPSLVDQNQYSFY